MLPACGFKLHTNNRLNHCQRLLNPVFYARHLLWVVKLDYELLQMLGKKVRIMIVVMVCNHNGGKNHTLDKTFFTS